MLRFMLLCIAPVFLAAQVVPEYPIAIKKEVLFSDDFEGAAPATNWHKVVPTFTVTNGVLHGIQTREKDVTNAEGKVTIKAHAAVHGLSLATKDSVVQVKIRFDGAAMMDVEFDDRAYTNSHYGHICRAQVRTNGVTIVDERDGSMRNDIRAMASVPAKSAERAKLLAGRYAVFPLSLSNGIWYTLVVETVNDAMRVTIDGKPAGYLKSSGIGHPTKSKLEFGIAGKGGAFDDLMIWNAEPAEKQ